MEFLSAGRKHVAEFYRMFHFGKGIASGKLQTSQRRLVKTSTERMSNNIADFSIRMSILFFRLTLLRKFQIVT